jgi:hypothetical protein
MVCITVLRMFVIDVPAHNPEEFFVVDRCHPVSAGALDLPPCHTNLRPDRNHDLLSSAAAEPYASPTMIAMPRSGKPDDPDRAVTRANGAQASRPAQSDSAHARRPAAHGRGPRTFPSTCDDNAL